MVFKKNKKDKLKMRSIYQRLIVLIIIGLPLIGFACDVCRGNPESSLSEGMDMAIMTLLGVTGSVLGGFATFFVYLKKQASAFKNKSENSAH